MSASDELPSGDSPAPSSVLTGTIAFLNAGGNLGTLLQGAIFGTIVSVATGGVNLIQSIFNLVVSPLDAIASATGAFVQGTIIEPLGIVETTAQSSATGIASQFGPFAFPIGIAVLLAGFLLIRTYLRDPESSDTLPIPGFPDVPAIGPIDVGVTEEGEEED